MSAIKQIAKTVGGHRRNCKEQEQQTLEQFVCWKKPDDDYDDDDDDDDDDNDSILRKFKTA